MDQKNKHIMPSPSSFRDPSGFLFFYQGDIYRQINNNFRKQYDHFINSGLYRILTERKLLVPHIELADNLQPSDIAYRTIKPEVIPFISYPHEWCFSQLKDAALCTLKLQKIAQKHGMTLRDASAFNIQFKDGRPCLIDTLSFEVYVEGSPWVAYRQFCQHFLAPLALMSYRDHRLGQLWRSFIDGIPLDLASLLLPKSTFFRLSLLTHIHLHARAQKYFADKQPAKPTRKLGRHAVLGLIANLEAAVRKLLSPTAKSQWSDYYDDIHYSQKALQQKSALISEFLEIIRPKTLWDLGANTGFFSRLASEQGIMTISFDFDHGAVEKNYAAICEHNETNLLPLVLDLTNPTSRFGWANEERLSFLDRGPVDAVFALALVHHLCISNNVPLDKLSHFLSRLSSWLVIEFVPKSDNQVQRLLSSRVDIFPDYNQESFLKAFSPHFENIREETIPDTERYLYLLRRKTS